MSIALILIAFFAALMFYPVRTLVVAASLFAVYVGWQGVEGWHTEQMRRERLIAERHCPAELAAFRKAHADWKAHADHRRKREVEAQDCVRRHMAFGGLYARSIAD